MVVFELSILYEWWEWKHHSRILIDAWAAILVFLLWMVIGILTAFQSGKKEPLEGWVFDKTTGSLTEYGQIRGELKNITALYTFRSDSSRRDNTDKYILCTSGQWHQIATGADEQNIASIGQEVAAFLGVPFYGR